MDPNETLRKIRSMLETREGGEVENSDILAELMESLDEWLSKGGFLPDEWAQHFHRRTLARITDDRQIDIDNAYAEGARSVYDPNA
jgi:hypothetical protein